MSAGNQEQALLDLIAIDRARRCSEIAESAQREVDDLLRQAHLHARERVRRVLGEARERARERVTAALAQRHTRERLAQQGSASDFLERALRLLPAALVQRWEEPQARMRWTQMALAQARQSLPPGPWRIEHAAGLQPQEIAALAADSSLAEARSFQLNPQLPAGVRVLGNGNCIDASLAGLLSDRDSLAAALLQAWEARP